MATAAKCRALARIKTRPAPGITQGVPTEEMMLVMGEYTKDNNSVSDALDLVRTINLILMMLTPREEKFLRQRFFKDMRLKEIGDDDGVSKEVVRVVINRSLRRMRHFNISGLLKDFCGRRVQKHVCSCGAAGYASWDGILENRGWLISKDEYGEKTYYCPKCSVDVRERFKRKQDEKKEIELAYHYLWKKKIEEKQAERRAWRDRKKSSWEWECPDCGSKLKSIQPHEYHPNCKEGDARGCSNPGCNYTCIFTRTYGVRMGSILMKG